MDGTRFDSLTRRLGATKNRRAALRLAGAGLAASLVPALGVATGTEAAELGAENCLPAGLKCGKKRQPRCKQCCSGYTSKKRRQKRCTCRPDLDPCSRADQCCSGICKSVPCAGIKRKRCIPGLLGGQPTC